MPPRVPPSRIAQALEYLQGLKSGVGEFVGGVGSNLADRAKAAGGLAYEALTSDPNISRMNTAEFSQAAADRAPTPRLDQAAQDIGAIGKAILTQPVQTGKAIVRGEVDRAKEAMTSPQAAGQYAGSFIDPTRLAAALRHRIPISELDVYHGTPHKYAPTEANPLGEFDASKIGTGEGAQAYGHGIYLAEAPQVAEGYKNTLSKSMTDGAQRRLQAAGGDIDKAISEASAKAEKYRQGGANSYASAVEEDLRGLQQYKQAGKFESGSLYKADLPDQMIDRMLDWDKPLSKDAPQEVKNAFNKLAQTYPDLKEKLFAAYREGKPGSHYYSLLNDYAKTGDLVKNQSFASDAMRQAGIPGIRYLDEGSRNTAGKWIAKHSKGGETAFNTETELNAFLKRNPEMSAVKPKQTRNFVVFPGEEKKVRILERNGQPAPERIAQALEAAPTAARLPTALPTVKPGDVINGYKVRPDIPNQSSIAASLANYEVLPGIRSINMTEFDPQYVRSISPDKLDSRTRKLMDEISQSKELNPLIVAYDSKGPYIIEGGHRFDALAASKAKSVPAMVVIDMDDPPR